MFTLVARALLGDARVFLCGCYVATQLYRYYDIAGRNLAFSVIARWLVLIARILGCRKGSLVYWMVTRVLK